MLTFFTINIFQPFCQLHWFDTLVLIGARFTSPARAHIEQGVKSDIGGGASLLSSFFLLWEVWCFHCVQEIFGWRVQFWMVSWNGTFSGLGRTNFLGLFGLFLFYFKFFVVTFIAFFDETDLSKLFTEQVVLVVLTYPLLSESYKFPPFFQWILILGAFHLFWFNVQVLWLFSSFSFFAGIPIFDVYGWFQVIVLNYFLYNWQGTKLSFGMQPRIN